MIAHLFALLRARLRGSLLLIAELTISFLVLFGTVTFFTYNLGNNRQPLGFSYENIWEVTYLESYRPDLPPLMAQAMAQVRGLPQVEAVEVLSLTPFSRNIGITGGLQVDGRSFSSSFNVASAGMNQMLKIPLLAGRWFQESDDGAVPVPVVIDTLLAQEMFGDKNPLGQVIHQEEAEDKVVIGVIDQFRYRGPYSSAQPYLINFWSQNDFQKGSFIDKFQVAVKPGTSASFEKTLLDTLQAHLPGLSLRVKPWKLYLQKNKAETEASLYTLGLVSAFLQLMVALGLLGVLWQNVIGRKVEFGIRRALGATAFGVLRQVVGEMSLLALIGIAIGALLLVQIPYGAWFPDLDTATLLLGFAGAAGLTLILVAFCAGYAGQMAMKLRPADSLRGD